MKIGLEENITITEVTTIIYYHCHVQLLIANVGFFRKFLINMMAMLKKALLKNTLTGKLETNISWNWNDRKYVGDNSKNKRQSLKKIVALHFARSMYVIENPNTNLVSTSEKLKVKVHSVDMIPTSWQSWVIKKIEKFRKQF